MPFVRFSRDKRGYEQVYLVHSAPVRRGKPARSRVLYYYRTPPGVKVGREPFDEAVRKTLEAQYPAIVFDWPKIVSAQPPPPDAEHWRERRRAERAAKQARAAEEHEEAAAVDAGDEVDEAPAAAEAVLAGEVDADIPTLQEAEVVPVVMAEETAPAQAMAIAEAAADARPETAAGEPRRRRRRGGRRRRRVSESVSDTVSDTTDSEHDTSEEQ